MKSIKPTCSRVYKADCSNNRAISYVLTYPLSFSWFCTAFLAVFICPQCSHLVANSRAASHLQHCTTNLISSSALLTHVSPSTTAGPVPAALSEPTTPNLPSLEEVCELKCPTLRFVPKKARPAFAKVLSTVLRSILSENTAEAWLRLLMLPKCVLPSLKCNGRHSRPTHIEFLCERWSRNELESLWRQAKENSRSTPTRQDADFKQSLYSAITLARLGMYDKACRMLLSDGIAPHSDTTWELLKAKHPSCTPHLAPAPEPTSPRPSLGPEFNIAALLQSFPRGTSAGPSGLRVQHLLDPLTVSTLCLPEVCCKLPGIRQGPI